MRLLKEIDKKSTAEIGEHLHGFAAELFPICRSISGNGLRHTLAMIKNRIPLETFEVASGTQVFDWIVPKEWNVRDAYIKDRAGRRVVDFQQSNLHLMSYSSPVRTTMSLSELKSHLFTLQERPDWIPYRTSYYQEGWGFCISHNQLLALQDGVYEVYVDSSIRDGHLSYGECFLPGRSSDEILISCHVCHPSLANDNLSGLVVSTALAQLLSGKDLNFSYRFLFVPGTIGAITWLAQNQASTGRIRHGLVLTCLGDGGPFHYKKSRRGDSEIDRVVAHVLSHLTQASEILEFSPYGYDERQYCSPGFDLPVGCLMRSVWGTFPEYHTSADNLEFIKPQALGVSLRVCAAIIEVLEENGRYRNLNPFCEPQLGRRGLYRSMVGDGIDPEVNARLWVLNLSDGDHSLLDIAERSKIPFPMIREATEILCKSGLLSLI